MLSSRHARSQAPHAPQAHAQHARKLITSARKLSNETPQARGCTQHAHSSTQSRETLHSTLAYINLLSPLEPLPLSRSCTLLLTHAREPTQKRSVTRTHAHSRHAYRAQWSDTHAHLQTHAQVQARRSLTCYMRKWLWTIFFFVSNPH